MTGIIDSRHNIINKFFNYESNKIEKYITINTERKDKINKFNGEWSESKIEDELTLNLSCYADFIVYDYHDNFKKREIDESLVIYYPYQEQARENLYKINLSNRPIIFEIYQCHLHPKLQKELFKIKQIDNNRYERIVTNSVKRLYESENFEYFHTSGISGKIFWKIV
jgi:hypothetical protein